MYAANLSWRPTHRILRSLVQQDLLMEIDNTESQRSKKRYVITEKGSNVVNYFERAKGLLQVEEILS
jgi:predicted transcriptional regulator